MTRYTNMLQSLLDGQAIIRKDIKEVNEEVKNMRGRLAERIDKLGLQLARLEDDTPTREEFEGLEKKVTKIQHHLALD